jgi:hypothetical protein
MAKFSLVYHKQNLINKPYSFYEYVAIFLAVKIYRSTLVNDNKFYVESQYFDYIFNVLSLMDITFYSNKSESVFEIKKVNIRQIGKNEEPYEFLSKKSTIKKT